MKLFEQDNLQRAIKMDNKELAKAANDSPFADSKVTCPYCHRKSPVLGQKEIDGIACDFGYCEHCCMEVLNSAEGADFSDNNYPQIEDSST